MALKAIIFDFDGTLVNSGLRQYNWFRFWAKENGREMPFADLGEFMEFYNQHCNLGGVQRVYDLLGLPCDMNDKSHPVWAAYELFKKHNPSGLCEGVKEMLNAFRAMKGQDGLPLKLAINTNNTLASVRQELVREGVMDYFQHFVTEETLAVYHGAGNPDSIKKPSRIPMALSLNLLNVEGENALHVGDTLHDLLCCQKVMRLHPDCTETIKTAGVSWGFEGRRRLEQGADTPDGKVHFDYIIDKPGELVDIVKKLI